MADKPIGCLACQAVALEILDPSVSYERAASAAAGTVIAAIKAYGLDAVLRDMCDKHRGPVDVCANSLREIDAATSEVRHDN